jgi:hypothetical protein
VSVYEEVVAASKVYLGPAAEAFLNRQCKWHLKKLPAEMTRSDLAELAKWCEIGGGLVMDKAKATEFANKVKAL